MNNGFKYICIYVCIIENFDDEKYKLIETIELVENTLIYKTGLV